MQTTNLTENHRPTAHTIRRKALEKNEAHKQSRNWIWTGAAGAAQGKNQAASEGGRGKEDAAAPAHMRRFPRRCARGTKRLRVGSLVDSTTRKRKIGHHPSTDQAGGGRGGRDMSPQEGSIAPEREREHVQPCLFVGSSLAVLCICLFIAVSLPIQWSRTRPRSRHTHHASYGFGCEMVGASSERHHFLKCHFLPPASGRSWSRYTRRPRHNYAAAAQELVTDGQTTPVQTCSGVAAITGTSVRARPPILRAAQAQRED